MMIRTICRAGLGLALFVTALAPAVGAQAVDTLPRRAEPLFTGRDALVLGGFTLASIALSTADERIARDLQDSSLQANRTVDDIADGAAFVNEKSLFVAGAVTYGIAKLAGGERTADVAFHATEAIVISSALATVVRGALGRSRPFVTGDAGEYDAYDFEPGKGFSALSHRAWPSIHASAAMSVATVLAHEISRDNRGAGRIATPLLYGAAALPGLGRMYGDKHWASDVLMGMGLGWWTGRKVVRYHHSRETTKLDRWFLSAGGSTAVVTVRF
jgi:membrane-associated phospholipid phosphatase